MTEGLHEPHAKQVLQRLEAHWKHAYSRDELHTRLRAALIAIRQALERNARDTRVLRSVLARMARGERISRSEKASAEAALHDLLRTLGIALVGILPGSLITLPALHVLARHFRISLVKDGNSREKHD